MKLKPLGNNVLIEPMEKEKVTAGGIVIPDSAKEKPQEGKVVAVGPGRIEDGKRVEMDVKIGDTVLYKKWGGDEVKSKGREYLLVKEDDIIAVLED